MKAKIQFCIKLFHDECFILTTEEELGVMLVSYKFTFVTSSQVGGGGVFMHQSPSYEL